VLLRVHFYLFSILRSGIVGTGVVWPADMLISDVFGTHFVDCYVITLFWDVTYLTFVGRADHTSGCKISEV